MTTKSLDNVAFDPKKELKAIHCKICGDLIGGIYTDQDISGLVHVCSKFNGKCIKEFKEKVTPPRPEIVFVGGELPKRKPRIVTKQNGKAKNADNQE